MKLVIFEGTPEEWKAAAPMIQGTVVNTSSDQPAVSTSTTTAVADRSLTEEVAKAFITRRALPKMQKDVIRHVQKAKDIGITSSELAAQIKCDPELVKGAMRSFGKRAAHTPGWPEGLNAFIRTWEGSENRYRLLPAIRAVLENGSVQL